MSNKIGGKIVVTTPRTMRAAHITAFRHPLQLAEVPVAAPRANAAVVRVEANGVCAAHAVQLMSYVGARQCIGGGRERSSRMSAGQQTADDKENRDGSK